MGDYERANTEPKAEILMLEPSELDLAQLRHDMRQLYRHLGYEGSVQVLYEMMKGAEVFAEVILQERAKEGGSL